MTLDQSSSIGRSAAFGAVATLWIFTMHITDVCKERNDDSICDQDKKIQRIVLVLCLGAILGVTAHGAVKLAGWGMNHAYHWLGNFWSNEEQNEHPNQPKAHPTWANVHSHL